MIEVVPPAPVIYSSYEFARDQVKSGDVIAIRSKNGGLPALVRKLTKSPYTHTAVAVWMEDSAGYAGIYVAEMDGDKNVLVPLSRYEGKDFDVFACPIADRNLVVDALQELLRDTIDYDYGDLLRIAAYKLLRWPLPKDDRNGYVCSSFTAAILAEADLRLPVAERHLPDMPLLATPADVVAALGTPNLIYRP